MKYAMRRWRCFNLIVPVSAILTCVALVPARAQGPAASGDLSLEQARRYMLDLINRDRAAYGLRPVSLDPMASRAGQEQAEEMAAHSCLAHFNLAGESPQQRYTRCGGREPVSENVALLTGFYGGGSSAPYRLDAAPRFSRRELERIERMYMCESAPYDGHRRNILNPYSTHVGIALARAGTDSAFNVANTQEFIRRATVQDLAQSVPTETWDRLAGWPSSRPTGTDRTEPTRLDRW